MRPVLLLLLVGSLAAAPAAALSLAAPECGISPIHPTLLQPRLVPTAAGLLAATPTGSVLVGLDGKAHGLVPGAVAVAASPDGRWAVLPFHPSVAAQAALEYARSGNFSGESWANDSRAGFYGLTPCDVMAATAIDLANGREFRLEGRGLTAMAASAGGVVLLSQGLVHVYRWGEWDGPTRLDIGVSKYGHKHGVGSEPPSADLVAGVAIASMALSPDGRVLAVLPKDGPFLLLFDATTGAPLDPLVPDLRFGFADRLVAAAFAPDGSALAVLTTEPAGESRIATLHLFSLSPVAQVASARWPALPDSLFDLAWVSGGILVISQPPSPDGGEARLSLHDAAGLAVVAEASLPDVRVWGAAAVGDGVVTLERAPGLRLRVLDANLTTTREMDVPGVPYRYPLPAFPHAREIVREGGIGMDVVEEWTPRDLPAPGALALLAGAAGVALALRRR